MSGSTETIASEVERRKRSKEAYEAVIRCTDYNSGRVQPPLAKQSSVIGSLHAAGYGSYGLDELHRAIRAACSNGDLFRMTDGHGDVRLGIDDAETLVEKVQGHLIVSDDPHSEVIALANERLGQLGHGHQTKRAVGGLDE
ncbi:hypothetical protein [Halopiger goleimassiliensis]|uniref:hypothetical protein n=1 Tax=Halopiger goleimassiliensis TaxID=1293048 RepID=UPI000677B623|nr:hypothetical protein [Halopiger goleimassiliensis]